MSEAANAAPTRASRKLRVGQVVSARMQKTIVVRVDRLVEHGFYPRVVHRATRFKVHDETSAAKVGDWVRIMETRPLSKDKRWRLVEVLRHGEPVKDRRDEPAAAHEPQEGQAAA